MKKLGNQGYSFFKSRKNENLSFFCEQSLSPFHPKHHSKFTSRNWTSVGILVSHEVLAGSSENDVLSHIISAA